MIHVASEHLPGSVANQEGAYREKGPRRLERGRRESPRLSPLGRSPPWRFEEVVIWRLALYQSKRCAVYVEPWGLVGGNGLEPLTSCV